MNTCFNCNINMQSDNEKCPGCGVCQSYRTLVPVKPLYGPVTSFEDMVEGLEPTISSSLSDVLSTTPTEDQQEAIWALLLAFAEERWEDLHLLLNMTTTNYRDISIMLMEMLYAVHGMTDISRDINYMAQLKRQMEDSI